MHHVATVHHHVIMIHVVHVVHVVHVMDAPLAYPGPDVFRSYSSDVRYAHACSYHDDDRVLSSLSSVCTTSQFILPPNFK